MKTEREMVIATTSEVAVMVAVRLKPVMSATSPKLSPRLSSGTSTTAEPSVAR